MSGYRRDLIAERRAAPITGDGRRRHPDGSPWSTSVILRNSAATRQGPAWDGPAHPRECAQGDYEKVEAAPCAPPSRRSTPASVLDALRTDLRQLQLSDAWPELVPSGSRHSEISCRMNASPRRRSTAFTMIVCTDGAIFRITRRAVTVLDKLGNSGREHLAKMIAVLSRPLDLSSPSYPSFCADRWRDRGRCGKGLVRAAQSAVPLREMKPGNRFGTH
jgi:hypothetical protein